MRSEKSSQLADEDGFDADQRKMGSMQVRENHPHRRTKTALMQTRGQWVRCKPEKNHPQWQTKTGWMQSRGSRPCCWRRRATDCARNPPAASSSKSIRSPSGDTQNRSSKGSQRVRRKNRTRRKAGKQQERSGLICSLQSSVNSPPSLTSSTV